MIQPNMPRFLREGDEATISARIFNMVDKPLKGKATLKFLDPETNKMLLEQTQEVNLTAGGTTSATFNISLTSSFIPEQSSPTRSLSPLTSEFTSPLPLHLLHRRLSLARLDGHSGGRRHSLYPWH